MSGEVTAEWFAASAAKKAFGCGGVGREFLGGGNTVRNSEGNISYPEARCAAGHGETCAGMMRHRLLAVSEQCDDA